LKSIKFVIFDLDDTLIHSGINYTAIREKIYEFFPANYHLSNLQKTPILKLASQLKGIDEHLYLQANALIERHEEKSVESATIIDGADTLPKFLDQKHLLSAIYTNNTTKSVNLYLQKPKFNFLSYFDFLTREAVSQPKPDPEGILTLLKKYNVEKKYTVFIGDSFIDAGAAKSAGIKFILFNSRQLDLEAYGISPYAIINRWSEFKSIFN
jgi:phosphoglycolate phosphatase